jgi:hypothetical protein
MAGALHRAPAFAEEIEHMQPASAQDLPLPKRSYSLNPDVYVCEFRTSYILLDCNMDRYFRFSGQQYDWFAEICGSRECSALSLAAVRFARRLLDMKLITHHQPERPTLNGPIRPNPQTSLYDLPPCGEPPVHWRTMTAFLLAFAAAAHVRRTSHLKQTLASARRWAAVAPSHCSKDCILDLTRRFHSFTPYVFTSHEACFFRSLVLLKYLSLMGVSANWEFGVRPLPFSAHCWIEHDGMVLNDHLGHVSEYRKIMSV